MPHPILPIERLVNIDTGEEKLKLAFRKGTIWRQIIVDKAVLANSNKVTELSRIGVAVISQNAKAFVSYISDLENLNYDIIPERKPMGRFGHVPGEGFSPFVEGLIFDGDANFLAMFQTVRSRGSETKWLEAAAEIRGMSVTARNHFGGILRLCSAGSAELPAVLHSSVGRGFWYWQDGGPHGGRQCVGGIRL